MNWEAMTPEQKDALVAEKVFGRRIYQENTWGRWLLWRDDKPGLTEPIPAYTQSMDAAWLVVEKMSEPPIRATWEGLLPPNTWFMHYFEEARLWACSAQEAAEEICKAALQAAGVNLD